MSGTPACVSREWERPDALSIWPALIICFDQRDIPCLRRQSARLAAIGAAKKASVQHDTEIELKALVGGDKRSWDAFCVRYAPAINAAVRRAFGTGRPSPDDLLDAGQEVFLKLCRDDYKLLREFDPKRAKLATWIGIIAYSTTVDWLRRRRPTANIDDVPEAALAVQPIEREHLQIPDGLLSERQALVLKLIYDREMDVPDIAKLLKIEAQTVRSTHHKALIRLREHFNPDGRG